MSGKKKVVETIIKKSPKKKKKIKERERVWLSFFCEQNLERIGERGGDEIIKNLYGKLNRRGRIEADETFI